MLGVERLHTPSSTQFSKVLEETLYKALAPEDKWQNQEVLLERHPVISRAQRGDLIRVVSDVEARHGRHGLHVRAFKMTLLLKTPSSEQEEVKVIMSRKSSCSTL